MKYKYMSEEILEKYCQFILNKYEHIRSLDEHVTLTMKDYMPLQLGEERERLVEQRRSEQEDRKEYHEDFRVWREEHTAYKGYSITPVEVWKAVKNKKIVVKGDPGSGKTTLTQYVTFTLCTQRLKDKTGSSQDLTLRTIPTDLLPLVIDLKDWAGKSLSLSEYYISHVLKDSGLEKEIKPLVDKWLTSGRCIILFDGLDEVVEERDTLIKSLQNLTSGTYGNCHFVVTTRIVGYNNELSGWQHCEVMSLKDEHIKNYVQSYLKDTSTDFLTALKNTPQMSPFSRNPLLLHVLCFVFKKQGLRLPTQRIELYHHAVHEMLKLRNPEIPESIKENVLKEIAIYFLDGKEIFEEDFLRKILRGFLNKEGERHNEDDVLKEIVEKSGLLCRLGDGRHIFLHLTFQEYMDACYIAEKKENPAQFLEPVLFNPRFREVIRHTAGMLGSAEDIVQFIEFILEQKPLCYEFLHQPVLLAGLCIADVPENKINPALKELRKQILNRLWKLWSKTQYHQLQENIIRIFAASVGINWANIISNNFLKALRDEDSEVRASAAGALGKLSYAYPEIIQALLKALRDKDLWVRVYVAFVLGKLGRADPDVIQALLDALRDEDSKVRERAAEALGKLGRADPDVIQALLKALRDEDSEVRGCAAEALSKLGCADPGVIRALLKALRDKDSCVRVGAAWALGKLGCADPSVIQALLKALRDKDSWVRARAAWVLGKQDCADPGVIQALLNALRDEDSEVRGGVSEALGKLGRADPEIIQALLKALKDKDLAVRCRAATALGDLGCADTNVIQAILNTLKGKLSMVIGRMVLYYDRNCIYLALQRLVDIKLREGHVNIHPKTHPIAVDGFLHGKEDIIKKLTKKFPVYLNRTPPNITENDIKEWLLQFENPSWINLAIILLENIDYYGPERIKEVFCHFCDNILPKENQSKVIISLLGSLKDSSSVVNYTIAEKFMDRNLNALPLETILENMNPEEKVIVFVDDIIGSGKQAVQIFREWLGNEELELEEHHVEPLNSYQIEKFKKFKIYLFFFVGFEDGKQDVLKNLRDLGLNIQEIYSLTKLEKAVGCFHGASNVFSNDKERKEAEKLAREIGIQLFGDKDWSVEKKAERSLGYGNAQKLIVFFYNTPTATLPILWKEGTYNGKKWAPLFPRREKK